MIINFYDYINEGKKPTLTSKKPYGYWTKTTLQEEADKYETMKDFRKNNYNAYSASTKYNLLIDLFKNHPNKGYTNNIKNK